MRGRKALAFSVPALVLLCGGPSLGDDDEKEKSRAQRSELVRAAVAKLLEAEEKGGGEWPYEGVYRVDGEIPAGYRIGGTAIVCEALLYATDPGDAKAGAAIGRGVASILHALEDPLMVPVKPSGYDVRVWGHAWALELFCRLREKKRTGARAKEIAAFIPRLVKALEIEEIGGGGWNYATGRVHAPFVTAPVTQALLLARAQGEKVPDALLERARDALRSSRDGSGAFAYAGRIGKKKARSDEVPGSAARSAVCEATLHLLGRGSAAAIKGAIDAFHAHWDELEKRRAKHGTHEGPYDIAPYYFYYGHRYAAQAIELLPAADRPRERERWLAAVLRTREEDGTWNDRHFPRSRAYGTAMVVLGLLAEKQPMPPALFR